ncbi:hypothetical protein E2C01_001142 [Portunus trituberculatus]|uniref:Uncharacterized protein n=1 Tax=Portunus trituberculatus TaxID=210409 RepID=A0A5B7CIM5_PORTR|nr:hypothetical protein [Portunus trituberculatus]
MQHISWLKQYTYIRERLQLAEQRVEEELKRREKAESEECNLRFLLEQQNHRLEDLGNRVLPSVSEKKLNVLQTKVKKMKMEEIRMLRTEWELRDATSLAREREVLALKKAYWGLSLALKYGRCLKQGVKKR